MFELIKWEAKERKRDILSGKKEKKEKEMIFNYFKIILIIIIKKNNNYNTRIFWKII